MMANNSLFLKYPFFYTNKTNNKKYNILTDFI